jgi:hypothetical protein
VAEGANERVCVCALVQARRRNMRSWRDQQVEEEEEEEEEEEDGDDATLRMKSPAN